MRHKKNDTKVWVIIDYIGYLSPIVDILCLQEHNLTGDKVERNIKTSWKNKNLWSLEASPSKKVEGRKIGAEKGGIALCFHPRLQPLIFDRVSLADNRFQRIKSKGLEEGHRDILYNYASNVASKRCAMWNEFSQSLPTDC